MTGGAREPSCIGMTCLKAAVSHPEQLNTLVYASLCFIAKVIVILTNFHFISLHQV